LRCKNTGLSAGLRWTSSSQSWHLRCSGNVEVEYESGPAGAGNAISGTPSALLWIRSPKTFRLAGVRPEASIRPMPWLPAFWNRLPKGGAWVKTPPCLAGTAAVARMLFDLCRPAS
jgi:hypothetical protein